MVECQCCGEHMLSTMKIETLITTKEIDSTHAAVVAAYSLWLGVDVVQVHVNNTKTFSTVPVRLTTPYIHCSLLDEMNN